MANLEYFNGTTWKVADNTESGDIKQSLKTSDHGNWLIWQNGRILSRYTYSELWDIATANNNALINEGMFGTGDGSTTFTMGDILGRTVGVAGQGVGLTYRTFGSKVGQEEIVDTPHHKHDISHEHYAEPGQNTILGYKYDASGNYMDHGESGGTGPYPVNKSTSSGNVKYDKTQYFSGNTSDLPAASGGTVPSVNVMNPTIYFNLFVYCAPNS